jgi:hypothetical protein
MRLKWMIAESPAGDETLQVAKSAENGIALASNSLLTNMPKPRDELQLLFWRCPAASTLD